MSRLAFAAIVVCAVPAALRAQDASDSAAYRALTQTPIAAVPIPLQASLTGVADGPLTIGVRYGIMSFADSDYVNNVTVGGDLRLGAGRVGLAAGAYLPTCHRRDCAGHFMAELSFSQRLTGIAMGRETSRATLNIGVAVAAAIGTPRSTTLLATGARMPIALAPASRGFRLVPYLEPGFGTGLVHADGATDAGLRAMFGAGVGALGIAHGLILNAGVHRVFMRDGNWLAGVGLSYTRPR